MYPAGIVTPPHVHPPKEGTKDNASAESELSGPSRPKVSQLTTLWRRFIRFRVLAYAPETVAGASSVTNPLRTGAATDSNSSGTWTPPDEAFTVHSPVYVPLWEVPRGATQPAPVLV